VRIAVSLGAFPSRNSFVDCGLIDRRRMMRESSGDKPGALEATPDGSKVFVSIATSGNQTTIINANSVCDTDAPCQKVVPNTNPPVTITAPGGVPAPNANFVDTDPRKAAAPRTGLIVHFDRARGQWLDVPGRDWTPFVGFNLPNNDVFTTTRWRTHRASAGRSSTPEP
jgi:hypothetical protein